MHGEGGSSSSASYPSDQRPPRPFYPGSIAARRTPIQKARSLPSPAINRPTKFRAPPSPMASPCPSRGEIVADVAQKRCALLRLGPRPDHEMVDAARSRLREKEAALSKKLQEIVLSPRPDNFDRLEWRARLAQNEKACREAAEKEIRVCRTIVSLDEMHEECEKLLKEAEKRLVKIYESADDTIEDNRNSDPSTNERFHQESVKYLQDLLEQNWLERVNLSGKRLRLLPDELFGRIHGVTVLNLSGNQLEVIPDSIAVLGQLEELKISSNLLLSLPDTIGSLNRLKILNASGNKIRTLPDSINYCRSLLELDVSFNNLVYLPTNIGHELLNLQVLSIQYNKIQSLPSSICAMTSLRYLDAHFNELHGLPTSIGQLKSLQTLNLSSNFADLTELPHSIGDLTELRELDVSRNQIHSLPTSFIRLNKLVKLDLEQNPLSFPPIEVAREGIEAVRLYMAKRWRSSIPRDQEGQLMAPDTNRMVDTRCHFVELLCICCFQDCFRICNGNGRRVS
ncbi:hypothetical protein SAY87_028350 [Trapa incisa]|uniref:Leucine-rich repeat-containing protein n=1 Tax=Trapa incisa TaxID=236973 RepID=A0AAN7L1X0_9MYRT|nr:hypothetical protein SAY87_028350 [Trapa incisa]